MGIYLGNRRGTSLPVPSADVVRKISNPPVVKNDDVRRERLAATEKVVNVTRLIPVTPPAPASPLFSQTSSTPLVTTSPNAGQLATVLENLGIIPRSVPPPPPPPRVNRAVPRLDSALVELDPRRGAVDCFYVALSFSLDETQVPAARALRVFRAEMGHPNFSRDPGVISMHGVERISSIRASRRSRDARLDVERSLNDAGFFGALSSLNAKDGSNRRPDADAADASSGNTLLTPEQLGAETVAETFSLRGTLPLSSGVPGSSGVVTYTFIDDTVSYGRGYRYYLTTVDDEMLESARSSIVDVLIEGLRIPAAPSRLIARPLDNGVSLVIAVDDQLVEKFEIYRRSDDVSPGTSVVSYDVLDSSGFNVNLSSSVVGRDGFVKVAESLHPLRGGSTFIDRNVVPGRRYDYRVFSVDVFGNKSELSADTTVYVPERTRGKNDLLAPSLSVQPDPSSRKVRVTISCPDERVVALRFARRDLTLRETSFTVPHDVKLNNVSPALPAQGSYRRDGPVLRGAELGFGTWSGLTLGRGPVTIDDIAVQLEHVYQYRLFGVDVGGNETPHVYSPPTFLSSRRLVDPPLNPKVVSVSSDGRNVSGVRFSWQPANVLFSPSDIVGDRDALAASSVRALYEVQRLDKGGRWTSFPLVEETSIFDPTKEYAGDRSSANRPPFLSKDASYDYRVRTYVSGAFLSEFTQPVSVSVTSPIAAPWNFRVVPGSPNVLPLKVVINWDDVPSTAPVDRWLLQRCVVNNAAAASLDIFSRRSTEKILDFKDFRVIFPQGSRGRSSDQDGVGETSPLFVGDRYFVDLSVVAGNSYFYRLCAVGLDGKQSAWSYGGVRLETSQSRARVEALDDATRTRVASLPIPFGPVVPEVLSRSMSINPDFSRPKRERLDILIGPDVKRFVK